ncbi:MAG: flavin-containing monooxygenase [Longimicrobiales bacterium]
MELLDCVVIGAGPAGLATSHELKRQRVSHLVLERGPAIGDCWRNTYDSLRLHTGKHLSALPGLRFPHRTPLFPSRDDFVDYLNSYALRRSGPIQLRVQAQHIRRVADCWHIETNSGELRARTLVMATGIMSNPVLPCIEGQDEFQGTIRHSVEYRRPQPLAGQRVLVLGVGNSGGEIASELGRHGVAVAISVRSGANVVPLTIAGLPTQYLATLVRKLPRGLQLRVVDRIRQRNEARRPPVLPRSTRSPLDAIPLIGFHLVDAIRDGQVALRGPMSNFTGNGVRFASGIEEDFDAVIMATGFRAALQPMADWVQIDARGFAERHDRVRSRAHDTLFFVGHNYDSSGGLRNINRDSRLAAQQIARRFQ